MRAENGSRNDRLVIATSDAIRACLVTMSTGTITTSVVSALMVSAFPLVGDPQAWLKCRSPIAALMLSLHRMRWKLLDPLTLLDDASFSWNLQPYPASWIAHAAKFGVR
eukprot:2503808-Pyramimonas_sp.AAC.1